MFSRLIKGPSARWSFALLIALGLWSFLGVSLQAGSMRSISASYSAFDNFQAVRTLFPLIAGFLAMALIFYKLRQHRSGWRILAGPLTFTAVYGLIGLIAAPLSPNGPLALYWAFAYLSVPLVLWAITWGNDSLELVGRLVDYNSFLILLGVVALFAFALLYLDLGKLLLTPESWYRCELNSTWNGHTWLSETGGNLRPTGVGRLAAIASIVGIGALSRGNRKFLWGVILVMALFLLFTSGARTAMFGFAVAAPMVMLLHWGRWAVLAGVVAAAVLVPLLLLTSIGSDFARECLRATQAVTIQLPAEPPVQDQKPTEPVATALKTTPQAQLNQEQPTAVPGATIQGVPGPTPDISSREQPTAVPGATIQGVPGPTPDISSREQPTAVPGATIQGVPGPTTDISNQEQPTVVPGATIQGVPGPTPDNSSREQPTAVPGATIQGVPGPTPDISSREQPENTRLPDSELERQETPVVNGQVGTSGESASGPEHATKPAQVMASAAPALDPAAPAPVSSFGGTVAIRKTVKVTKFTSSFTTLSGRTGVWREGLELFKDSPVLGRGFHADRLLLGPLDPAGGRLGTHLHNSYIHALVQTGIIGFIPFLAAWFYGWFLLVVVLRIRRRLPPIHQQIVIQSAGILVFLSIRTVTESTGAFFGVDWLILAPLLLYLQVLNRSLKQLDEVN